MAKPTRRRDRRDEDQRRGIDQVVLTILLFFIPISLFGFVGFRVMVATGTDPYAYLPAVEVWEMALAAALIAAIVLLAVTIRGYGEQRAAHQRERPERPERGAGRWDSFSTPFRK